MVGNLICTIYTMANQLIMFHDRFNGDEPDRGHLEVLLIGGKVHCKVEFRDTPDTNGNNNLLSKLNLRSSSPNMDRQVSHLFKLLSEIDWKNRIFYCSLLPCSLHSIAFGVNLKFKVRRNLMFVAGFFLFRRASTSFKSLVHFEFQQETKSYAFE